MTLLVFQNLRIGLRSILPHFPFRVATTILRVVFCPVAGTVPYAPTEPPKSIAARFDADIAGHDPRGTVQKWHTPQHRCNYGSGTIGKGCSRYTLDFWRVDTFG